MRYYHMNYNHIVAFDVGKDALVVQTRPGGKPRKIANRPGPVKILLQRELKRNDQNGGGAMLVVVEATGGYERTILDIATALGIDCHRAHGSSVRAYAKYRGQHAKSDPLDAALILDYAMQTSGLVIYKPPGKEQELLRELKAMRGDLMKSQRAELNRLEHARAKPVIKARKAVIRTIERQLGNIETQISQLMHDNEDFARAAKLMQSVTGVGPQTAISVLAHMPELGQLKRGTAAALAGLAPYNNDSSKHNGKRRIFGGRATLRACLYNAAKSAMRHNHVLKPFAHRLTQRGLPYKTDHNPQRNPQRQSTMETSKKYLIWNTVDDEREIVVFPDSSDQWR